MVLPAMARALERNVASHGAGDGVIETASRIVAAWPGAGATAAATPSTIFNYLTKLQAKKLKGPLGRPCRRPAGTRLTGSSPPKW